MLTDDLMEVDYTKPATRKSDGRLALIATAERLFAEFGVSGVSLRQINEASGARNASAVHYHFKSREGLVMAILEHRIGVVDARRQAHLDMLEEEGRLDDLRAVIGAIVRPIAQVLAPPPDQSHYLRFLERVVRDPVFDAARQLPEITGWQRTNARLSAFVAYLPPEVATLRIDLTWEHAITGLGSIETRLARGELAEADIPLRLETLIDVLTAGFIAPVSPDCQRAFGDRRG